MRQQAILSSIFGAIFQASKEHRAKYAIRRLCSSDERAGWPPMGVPGDSFHPLLHQHPHSVPQRGSHWLLGVGFPQWDPQVARLPADKSVEQKKSFFLKVF